MAFYVVYIQEAHPIDAWQAPENVREHIRLASARSLDERCAVAATCVEKLGIQFPALVDSLTNSTEAAYTAWPDRLYVIDRQGRIAYKSAPGPYGFRPVQVARALEQIVPQSAR